MEFDPVTKPVHYNLGGIECLDAMEASMTPDEFLGYLKGNIFKYLWRWRHKSKGAEDLGKAAFYLGMLQERVKKREDATIIERAMESVIIAPPPIPSIKTEAMFQPLVGAATESSMPADFIIYSTPTCKYCDEAKAHLYVRGLTYEERDARDADHRDALRKAGLNTVPQIYQPQADGTSKHIGGCQDLKLFLGIIE